MKLLRKISMNYYGLYIILQPIVFTYRFFRYYSISDELAVERKYKKVFGEKLNLKNPKKFTEKLQWLKLNDRKDWYTQCADKMSVRGYVTKKLGTDKYLIPLYFTTENYKDIIEDNIQAPSVIKCSHDNNSYKILKNKKNVNWKEIQKYYRTRLKSINLFWSNREWPYKNIKKRYFMVEELLQSSSAQYKLQEFRCHCFNKELKIIDFYEISDDDGKKARVLHPDFSPYPEEYSMGYKRPNINLILPDENVKNEMLNIVKVLAQDFDYQIRIDIYHVDGNLYIGELTFFDGAGFDTITPKGFDLELGDMLKLPTDIK